MLSPLPFASRGGPTRPAPPPPDEGDLDGFSLPLPLLLGDFSSLWNIR